ncbi:MAG: DNA-directed RNA polymerase subunit alpha [Clostridia bacterium]|nr:DNA-directed RNA polymerase subunit alpha [Clostridia bacterium]
MELGKIIIKNASPDGKYAEFVVDPLDRGFGSTLGNSLRRVLLSFLPGSAASSVKIDGVTHEFSTIPGIREDVTEIILNIKDIVVRLEGCDAKTVYVNLKGPCEFTADMIESDADLKVLSNNLIATLDEGAELKMEITFTSGIGYVSAEQNRDIMPSVMNLIPVDSLYSPITKVNYVIENTRVGQITDYDKLILKVWTNGVISPQEAVAYASNLLMEHFAVFRGIGSSFKLNLGYGDDFKASLGDLSLDDLGFSVRTHNALKRVGIERLSQILVMKYDEIAGIRNLGKKSCDEIVAKIKEFGWKNDKTNKKKVRSLEDYKFENDSDVSAEASDDESDIENSFDINDESDFEDSSDVIEESDIENSFDINDESDFEDSSDDSEQN